MAGQISKEFIDEVVARHDIYNTLSAYLKLKKTGKNFTGLCPFHQEKTPSFNVNPHKQFYHCFGCGASGNVLSFIMHYENASFLEALELLALQVGLEIPKHSAKAQENHREQYQLLEQVAAFYQHQWQQPHASLAIDYLKKRGLSGQIAKTFCLGYAPSGWDNLVRHFRADKKNLPDLVTTGMVIEKSGKYYDRFRDRVMFPIRDKRGRVIGFGGRTLGDETPKYLNSPETPIFHKGQELYGLYEALKVHHPLTECLIVEGYMDVLALAQHEITYACATLGTATTTQHLRTILRYTRALIFCFDGDNAGRKAAIRAMEISLPLLQDGVHVRILFLPQGEDPDSIVRQEGKEGFLARIESARSLTQVLFEHCQDQLDLSTLEGRAQLVDRATPLLQQIPLGALKSLAIDQLARLARIPADRLLKSLSQPGNKALSSAVIARATTQDAPQAPTFPPLTATAKRIVTLMIHHPTALTPADLNTTLNALDVNTHALLHALISHLHQHTPKNTGQLLEQWRDHPAFEILLAFAGQEMLLESDSAKSEILGFLGSLTQQANAKTIQQLLEKANAEGLSPAERIQLQDMIKTTKEDRR